MEGTLMLRAFGIICLVAAAYALFMAFYFSFIGEMYTPTPLRSIIVATTFPVVFFATGVLMIFLHERRAFIETPSRPHTDH